MILVNNQKFACEPCIKGHRAFSCAHSGRPLFQVAKKGRPRVPLCAKCRAVREAREPHSTCLC
ncbi:copper fist DNA binding domain-containing protein, partial [Mycena sp. CBHHK59/15]